LHLTGVRDAHGRVIVIEVQLDPADHDHLGKQVANAHAVQADAAMWAVAAAGPFLREHLGALAELNEAFVGRRHFRAVTVTLESESSPVPLAPGEPLFLPDEPGGVAAPRVASPRP
jgi:hypothetical protein